MLNSCLLSAHSSAAEAESSAFLMKLIFEKLEEMSRKLDRREESLEKVCALPPLTASGPHHEALQSTRICIGVKT